MAPPLLKLDAIRLTFGGVPLLNGASLQVQPGERIALVGRNGSGKSTLLKVCAGLIMPDTGSIDYEGTRAAILNPGAGLDTERTGFENIEAVGRLLGVPRSQRKALVEDVAEFTELGDFLSLPIRTYSTGMTVRLMFALATSVERDILVVDEVLGAGDAIFVEKAAKRVRALFNKAKILILATHAGTIAEQLCNKAIWMDCGREVMRGLPPAVWDAYINQRRPQSATRHAGVVA